MEPITIAFNYYTYIYLDTRKPGKYIYGDYCFLYEPFYVGKGRRRRIKEFSNGRRSKYFKRIINKIKKSGLEPLVIKIKENLNESDSFILESKLINLIGRKDLNSGPLINFTNGGEGSSGLVVSEETRKKQSLSRKGKLIGSKNPMYCKYGKLNPFFGKKHSKESRDKMSNTRKKMYKGKNNPMFGVKRSGELAPSHKLTENNVINIWKYLNEKELTQDEIGNIFGVNRRTISSIKNGRTWKYLRVI